MICGPVFRRLRCLTFLCGCRFFRTVVIHIPYIMRTHIIHALQKISSGAKPKSNRVMPQGKRKAKSGEKRDDSITADSPATSNDSRKAGALTKPAPAQPAGSVADTEQSRSPVEDRCHQPPLGVDPFVEHNPHGPAAPLKKKRTLPVETGRPPPTQASLKLAEKPNANNGANVSPRLAAALAEYSDTPLQAYVNCLNQSEASPPANRNLMLVKRNGPDEYRYQEDWIWSPHDDSSHGDDSSHDDESIDVGGGVALNGDGNNYSTDIVIRDTDTHAEAVGKLMRNRDFDLIGDGWIHEGDDCHTIMRPDDLMHQMKSTERAEK